MHGKGRASDPCNDWFVADGLGGCADLGAGGRYRVADCRKRWFSRYNTASRPTSPGVGWLASVRILGLFPPRQPLKSDKETLKATDLRPEPRGRGSGHSFGSWNGLRASVDRPLPCISARIGPVPLTGEGPTFSQKRAACVLSPSRSGPVAREQQATFDVRPRPGTRPGDEEADGEPAFEHAPVKAPAPASPVGPRLGAAGHLSAAEAARPVGVSPRIRRRSCAVVRRNRRSGACEVLTEAGASRLVAQRRGRRNPPPAQRVGACGRPKRSGRSASLLDRSLQLAHRPRSADQMQAERYPARGMRAELYPGTIGRSGHRYGTRPQ